MKRVLKRDVPPQNGATEPSPAAGENGFFVPDFGSSRAVITLVLIAALVAVVLSLAREPTTGYLSDLAKTSLLLLWTSVTSASLLNLLRARLAALPLLKASALVWLIVLTNVAVTTEVVFWFGVYYGDATLQGPAGMFPADHASFLTRNLLIGAVVTAAALRYFYVTHQWRSNVEQAADSRIQALHARIRPHFLFNSMNTIAALIPTNPDAAERAVEDLADLFRASLSNPGEPISLEEELGVARVYERMEQQRLGDRLSIEWSVDGLPMDTRVPGLTIQPLIENAIYHGIEPLAEGGLIEVVGGREGGMVTITVRNPLPEADALRTREGNRVALENIRQRLELAYGDRARLQVQESLQRFEVTVGFPMAA